MLWIMVCMVLLLFLFVAGTDYYHRLQYLSFPYSVIYVFHIAVWCLPIQVTLIIILLFLLLL